MPFGGYGHRFWGAIAFDARELSTLCIMIIICNIALPVSDHVFVAIGVVCGRSISSGAVFGWMTFYRNNLITTVVFRKPVCSFFTKRIRYCDRLSRRGT